MQRIWTDIGGQGLELILDADGQANLLATDGGVTLDRRTFVELCSALLELGAERRYEEDDEDAERIARLEELEGEFSAGLASLTLIPEEVDQ